MEKLMENSPFSHASQLTPTPPPTNQQLELRGVLVEGGVYWFNVFEPATKKSA